MEQTYVMPPVPEFRRHICSSLSFIYTFVHFLQLKNKGDTFIHTVIEPWRTERLRKKIEFINGNPFHITRDEMLLCYACHDLMNKILVSKAGEELSGLILERVKLDSHLKKFEDYRAYYIKVNNHMLQDIEKNLGPDNALQEMKQKLEAVTPLE